MFSEAFIHIGMEKTGTKSIQAFLQRNRDVLYKYRYLYPDSLGPKGHLFLAAYASELALNGLGKGQEPGLLIKTSELGRTAEERRATIVRNFELELSNLDPHVDKLILSDEHLHSRLTGKKELCLLAEFLSKYASRVTIIAYLRRQDRAAVSLASTRAKAGLPVDEVFPPTTPLPRYYDYFRIVDELVGYIAPARLKLRLFDRRFWVENDLISDFLDALEVSFCDDFARTEVKNQSLSPVAIEFMSKTGKYVPQFVDGRSNPSRKRLRKLLGRQFTKKGFLVDRMSARGFFDAFEESNRALAQKYFGLKDGNLFDDDFSEYPMDPERVAQATTDDMVEIASYLWSNQDAEIVHLRSKNKLLQGRLALAANKMGHAERCFSDALKIDPKNREAERFLDQIRSSPQGSRTSQQILTSLRRVGDGDGD